LPIFELRERKEQGVRALEILRERFSEQVSFLHASRAEALWRAVVALIAGRCLWLTALGRSWPTMAHRKHAIKSIDRLLGNKHLHRERFSIAAAVVALVLPKRCQPVVLVDTMEIRHRVVAVTASLAHAGRSLPIWSTTIKALRQSAAQGRRFLRELSRVLPQGCRPILVTDAGFETPWLDEVEKMGWDYVCRVRGQTKFLYQGKKIGCLGLHLLATNRARNLGRVSFPIKHPHERRVVLSKLPKSRHRRVQTRRGPGSDSNYKHYRKNAHEPLVLTTSLWCRPDQVVAIYALRMQIEESFRDLKCHRWGWSLRHCRSRSRARMEILLLIASIAMVAQQLVGMAGEACGLSSRHQANTVRTRRVLSVFLLGAFLLATRDAEFITASVLERARTRLRSHIAHLAPLKC
jgi:hypothetical protein